MKKGTSVGFILYVWCSISLWPPLAVCQNKLDSPFKVLFKQSAAISDKSGNPRNSRTYYFPAERFIDSSEVRIRVRKEKIEDSSKYDFLPGNLVLERKIQTRNDTFKLKWFSYDLYKLQEPILYNYPLKKEVYRFTLLRSFHPPVVISMEKEGNRIRLLTKELTEIPRLPGYRYVSQDGTRIIRVADTLDNIPFKIKAKKRISKADYKGFIELLDKLHVLYASPLGFRKSFGSDGSEWILETHRPEGYYFLVRWMPASSSPLRILGNYLLNLSDSKTKSPKIIRQ